MRINNEIEKILVSNLKAFYFLLKAIIVCKYFLDVTAVIKNDSNSNAGYCRLRC